MPALSFVSRHVKIFRNGETGWVSCNGSKVFTCAFTEHAQYSSLLDLQVKCSLYMMVTLCRGPLMILVTDR